MNERVSERVKEREKGGRKKWNKIKSTWTEISTCPIIQQKFFKSFLCSDTKSNTSLHYFFMFMQYFPTTVTIWIVYILVIFIVMTALKLINLSLHKMYDKARTLSETSLKKMSNGNTSGSGTNNNNIQRETSA